MASTQHGEPGHRGEPGYRGVQGEPGTQGERGERGRTGPQTKEVRVIRPRAWLFLLVMACMIFGLYRVSTNDCNFTAKLGGVYATMGQRAHALALLDTNPQARDIHLASAVTNAQVARQLRTGALGCPSFLP